MRDVFLFENRPVSYAMCFDALSEEDTVHGVYEAIRRHLGGDEDDDEGGGDVAAGGSAPPDDLVLCGHSFGSCQLAWMIKSPEISRMVRSLILLDPVSILLSEPDVVVNFLYAGGGKKIRDQRRDGRSDDDDWGGRIVRFVNETKIRLVASSEMFIEHYLRRNFAWYNSELWLEDIPRHVGVLVCLAERDEIVNAPKVEREVRLHNAKVSMDPSYGAPVRKIVWRDVGHAHCVTNPERWSDIRHAMRKMDADIMEEHSRRKAR